MIPSEIPQAVLQNKISLLYSTIFDVPQYTLQQPYKFSLLGFKKIIEEYQILNEKSLSESIKFYMIGSAIDQGIIDLAKQYEKQEETKPQNKKKQIETEGKGSEKESSKLKEHKTGIIRTNSRQQQKKICEADGFSLNQWIQHLQIQYHRQALTYQKVKQAFENVLELSRHKFLNPKELGFLVLEKMGKKDQGYITLKNILNFVSKTDGGLLKAQVKEQLKKQKVSGSPYLETLKNKLCNNVHSEAHHSKPAKILKGQLQQLSITIQNIIELFYRVSQHQKSLTFQLISVIVESQLKKIKDKEEQISLKIINQERSERNKKVLLEQMHDIRNEASSIVASKLSSYSKSGKKSTFSKETKTITHQQQVVRQWLSQKSSNGPASPSNIFSHEGRSQLKTHRQEPIYIQANPETHRRQKAHRDYEQTHIKQKTDKASRKKSKQKINSEQTDFHSQTPLIKPFLQKPSKQEIRQRIFVQLDKIHEAKMQNKLRLYQMVGL